MRTNLRFKKFFNLLNIPLLLYLIFCEINIFNKRLYANTKPPASKEDVFLYKQMGASYLCKAISEKIDFDFNKALAISTYTFAEVIFSICSKSYLSKIEDNWFAISSFNSRWK